MSLFSRILSIGDVLSRVPQFDAQVRKLEHEEEDSRVQPHLRGSFLRRCHDLSKQIDEHMKKVNGLKQKESTEEQRKLALDKLTQIQKRLLHLIPEREKSNSSVDSRIPIINEPSASLDIQETPVLVHTPQPLTVEVEEKLVENKKNTDIRRGSLMYDVETDDDSDEDVESEDATEVQPVEDNMTAPTTIKSNIPIVEAGSITMPNEIADLRSLVPEEVPVAANLNLTHIANTIVEGNSFVVLADLLAEEPTDLSIRKGEILTVTQTRLDGWWMARNSSGFSGLVPKTYLKHIPTIKEEQIAKRSAVEMNQKDEVGAHFQEEISINTTISKAVTNETFQILPVRCLGDALRSDHHLTFACHLTPRLSHSNIGFHDLYWNYQDDKIRKRHVRVSCLVRLVRLEGMPKDEAVCGLIRAALYDKSKKTGRQIVSNVHTIKAQVKNSNWSFISRADTTSSGVEYGDFILRSNYKMSEVVLLMEASTVISTEKGFEEKSLGILTLKLVDSSGENCLAKKTYAELLRMENIFDRTSATGIPTQHKVVLKILDVPNEIVPLVDSLSDVLIFNPMFVRLFFFFRRRAGTVLVRDRDNPLSAEIISDPLLAVFPFIVDQPDILDLLRSLWNVRWKTVKNKSEPEQAASFFEIFMNTAYCIYRTAIIPPYTIWDSRCLAARQKVFNKCVDMLREYNTATHFLLTQPSRPINIFDYSFDLLGPHALD